ncbi:MAG: hypothetical protein GXY83_34295 [Rhodopirellula sp.]|jgi:hypothetical protein|nr:hypothetical protein [Rhodopirellula sp.]
MVAFRTTLTKTPSLARWCWGAALGIGLALPGCCSMDLGGEKFREDELSATCQQMRPSEMNSESFGFSNKAKQIERNFGYQ